jgi:hypothetical protein
MAVSSAYRVRKTLLVGKNAHVYGENNKGDSRGARGTPI